MPNKEKELGKFFNVKKILVSGVIKLSFTKPFFGRTTCRMWDLSFPTRETRDQTPHPLQWERSVLTPGPPAKPLQILFPATNHLNLCHREWLFADPLASSLGPQVSPGNAEHVWCLGQCPAQVRSSTGMGSQLSSRLEFQPPSPCRCKTCPSRETQPNSSNSVKLWSPQFSVLSPFAPKFNHSLSQTYSRGAFSVAVAGPR